MEIQVLMLSKKDNVFCDYADFLLRSHFREESIASIRGIGDSTFPEAEEIRWYNPLYIISFLSPWIIPSSILRSAQKAAINFHPGSPNYPGIGCYNFALYEKTAIYGVTCHHMNASVDTGDIIMTSYFDISQHDTVESLKLKSMNHLLYCFDSILCLIEKGLELPLSGETWNRKPFTRKELNNLCYISPDCTDEEAELKIRATCYPSSGTSKNGAYTTLLGHNFYYDYADNDRKSIV